MAQPSKKAQDIDDFLIDLFGVDRKGAITSDRCAWCKGPATTFRDGLSEKEYTISGFCQKCQDDTFGE